MTCRADILAATPKCPGPVTQIGLQHGKPCARPLVWKHDHAAWVCPKHGVVLSGETAGLRVT